MGCGCCAGTCDICMRLREQPEFMRPPPPQHGLWVCGSLAGTRRDPANAAGAAADARHAAGAARRAAANA